VLFFLLNILEYHETKVFSGATLEPDMSKTDSGNRWDHSVDLTSEHNPIISKQGISRGKYGPSYPGDLFPKFPVM
jgi:hypothetical protein